MLPSHSLQPHTSGGRNRPELLQRLCVAGRYPDKAERLRPWSVSRFPALAADQIPTNFRDHPQGEINVIAGMAPMKGIQ
jgi:hypothetical protein